MSVEYKDPCHPLPNRTFLQHARRVVLFNTLAILLCPLLPFLILFQCDVTWKIIYRVFLRRNLRRDQCQNPDLVNKMWALPSAQTYLQRNALEYQLREGFCCRATQRCVLGSIDCVNPEEIPPLHSGPATAEFYSTSIDLSCPGKLKSTVVTAAEGFEKFLSTLRKVNQPKKYRVAVNFLRPALFGPPGPTYLPSSLLLGILGGHHSPIVAYQEETDAVLVFDVNHNYGALVLSPMQLFEAVDTFDPLSWTYRALVLTEIVTSDEDRNNPSEQQQSELED